MAKLSHTHRDTLLEEEHMRFIDSINTSGIPLWVYSVYYGLPSICYNGEVEESPRSENPDSPETQQETDELPF